MNHLDKQKIFESLKGTEFVCTFSGHTRSDREDVFLPQRAVLKTLLIDEKPHYQLNVYTLTQHFVTNFTESLDHLNDALDQCMAARFMQAHIQRPDFDQYFRRTQEKLAAKRTKPSKLDWEEVRQHNQRKQYLIDQQNAAELLRALHIMNEKQQIIPAMQAKYRQINHFLSLAMQVEAVQADTLRVIDCGCGKAYLSLALYHLLNKVMGKKVELIGIDNNEALVRQCNEVATTLGYESARFVHSSIADFAIEGTADIVIALHACDTATDDALALALRMETKAILAAPCCHHYVNDQMRSATAPELLAPLLRDGISRERFSDLLTDTMRRDILRSYGYSAELIEFVAQEHTMKNIMIRAEKSPMTATQKQQLRTAFLAAREEWHLAPKLAELMDL